MADRPAIVGPPHPSSTVDLHHRCRRVQGLRKAAPTAQRLPMAVPELRRKEGPHKTQVCAKQSVEISHRSPCEMTSADVTVCCRTWAKKWPGWKARLKAAGGRCSDRAWNRREIGKQWRAGRWNPTARRGLWAMNRH